MKILKNPYFIVGALVAIAIGFYLYFKYIISVVMRSKENPNVKAFLMMLRKCEGTAGPNGYRTTYAYDSFTDMSDHPAYTGEWTGKTLSDQMCKDAGLSPGCKSTAAGAYQITKSTWRTLKIRLNLKDFSEASQDLAAIELIREKNALMDVEQGRIKEAIVKVRKIWASLPGAGYGQPEKPLVTAISHYTAAGGKFTA